MSAVRSIPCLSQKVPDKKGQGWVVIGAAQDPVLCFWFMVTASYLPRKLSELSIKSGPEPRLGEFSVLQAVRRNQKGCVDVGTGPVTNTLAGSFPRLSSNKWVFWYLALVLTDPHLHFFPVSPSERLKTASIADH